MGNDFSDYRINPSLRIDIINVNVIASCVPRMDAAKSRAKSQIQQEWWAEKDGLCSTFHIRGKLVTAVSPRCVKPGWSRCPALRAPEPTSPECRRIVLACQTGQQLQFLAHLQGSRDHRYRGPEYRLLPAPRAAGGSREQLPFPNRAPRSECVVEDEIRHLRIGRCRSRRDARRRSDRA